MQKRKLGNSNLHVSASGLGCMSMTGGYRQSPDKATSGQTTCCHCMKVRRNMEGFLSSPPAEPQPVPGRMRG